MQDFSPAPMRISRRRGDERRAAPTSDSGPRTDMDLIARSPSRQYAQRSQGFDRFCQYLPEINISEIVNAQGESEGYDDLLKSCCRNVAGEITTSIAADRRPSQHCDRS